MTMTADTTSLDRFKAGEPGVYCDIPSAVYHASEACSATDLKRARKSFAICKYEHDNPVTTPTLILGNATHVSVLQPSLMDSTHVAADQCEAVKKSGERCGNPGKIIVGGTWLCGVHLKQERHELAFASLLKRHLDDDFTITCISEFNSHYLQHADGRKVRISDHDPGFAGRLRLIREGRQDLRADFPPYGSDDPRQVLSPDDWAAVANMTDSVNRHPSAKRLLGDSGNVELSLLWTDPTTGILCKARIDKLAENFQTVVDLKTACDASPDKFSRAIFERGYHVQAAHYLAGAAANDLDADTFGIIAVESSEPHLPAVYELEPEAVELGERERRGLVRGFAECLESGMWRGYPDEPQLIGLPAWATKKLETL